MPSVEHSPHGALTSKLVNSPSGIATSTMFGVALRLLAFEADDDLVEARRADLLVALLRLDRLGDDQPGLLQHLHVGRHGRLRQAEVRLLMSLTFSRPLLAQQLEDARCGSARPVLSGRR